MNLKVLVLLGVLLIITCSRVSSEAETEPEKNPGNTPSPVIDRSSSHHHHDPTYHGFWKKKFVWRSRWVKTWQEKKVYVALWKRMWGPVEVKEWVPVPRPPPGWIKHDVGSYVVKTHPH